MPFSDVVVVYFVGLVGPLVEVCAVLHEVVQVLVDAVLTTRVVADFDRCPKNQLREPTRASDVSAVSLIRHSWLLRRGLLSTLVGLLARV